MLLAWAVASPNSQVILIANSLPMKLWLTLFVINNLLCMIRFFSIAISSLELDKSEPTIESLKKKRNYITVVSALSAQEVISRLAARFRARGYKTIYNADKTTLRAIRWRLSSLGTLFFHFSLFLIVFGIVISPMLRTQAQAIVAEGDTLSTEQGERLIQVEPKDTKDRMPKFGFTVKKVGARFWKDELLFTDMRATIQPLESEREELVLLTKAWKPTLTTYVTLVGIGYAPLYRLVDDNDVEVESGYVNLAAFPPGIEDSFRLDTIPYIVNVKVFPDFRKDKGKVTNKSHNLKQLGYGISLALGNTTITSRFVRPNESIDVGRFHLSFPKMVYWGQFKIIHNPGLIFIWLGFLAGLTGLVWRLVFFRKDFTAIAVSDKNVQIIHLHLRDDYFPNKAIMDLQDLAKQIERWKSDG